MFCGSSAGVRPEYAEAAAGLGREVARRGMTLVYGAGNVGLMGVVADACMAEGGRVVGFIPESLLKREVGHRGITELYVTRTMHERKQGMSDLAEAFVALPGGIGTFEELFEILTWAQLGIHQKPVGILNTAGFYDPLLALLDHAVAERFLRPEHRALLLSEPDDPARLLDTLAAFTPPVVEKWIEREET